jgi:hypothetical protein
LTQNGPLSFIKAWNFWTSWPTSQVWMLYNVEWGDNEWGIDKYLEGGNKSVFEVTMETFNWKDT